MTTLQSSPYTMQAVNSHHAGVEFSVVHIDASETPDAIAGYFAGLAVKGWKKMSVPCAQADLLKFLISRKK